MPKKKIIVRNRVTLQVAILDCSEPAVHSHLFQIFFQKILVEESLFWSNDRQAIQSCDYILK